MAEITADGDIIVGRRRPKNHPLIRRIEVGKAVVHNDLPPLPADYTFGAPLKRDAEGAGDVMLTWQTHAPPPSKMTYDFGRDFVTLNRRSVTQKCVTAKDIAAYRVEHDARIKPKVSASKPTIAPLAVIADPSHSFGAKTEKSESVADLIQNRWEFEWVAEQKSRCEALESAKAQESKRRKRTGDDSRMSTKSQRLQAMLRSQSATPDVRDTYTLPQFRDIPSRFSAATPAPY